MKAKTILFPTDFSTVGDAAMEMATSLARDTDAVLLIVHVEEAPMVYGGGDWYYGPPEPSTPQLEKMLEEVAPTQPTVVCERRLVTGEPADAIIRVAKEEDVDFIVMGTHGRTGITRLLMGSVAEAVVRRAPCPVLTFKQSLETPAKAK